MASYNKTAVADFEASSSQYLSIAHASQTGLELSGSSTWLLWFNSESVPTSGNRQTLISKYDASNGGYEINRFNSAGTQSVEIRIREDASTEDVVVIDIADLYIRSTSAWNHLAVTADFSGGSLSLITYANGALWDTTAGSTTAIGASSQEFAVGSRSGGSNYYDGLMSDIHVIPSVLTQDEIIAMMRHYRVYAGSVGHWKLDNALIDQSNNANHLTNNNTVTFDTTNLSFPTYGRSTRFIVGTGDGRVQNEDVDWDTTHDAATGDAVQYTGVNIATAALVAKPSGGALRTIYRCFLPFDTSDLDPDLDIVGGTIGFHVYASTNTLGGQVCTVQTTQASNTVLTTADFDQVGTTEGASRFDIPTTLDATHLVNLNSNGFGWISDTGFTNLGFRIDRDLDDDNPVAAGVKQDSFSIRSGNNATENFKPFLDVIDDDAALTGGAYDDGLTGTGSETPSNPDNTVGGADVGSPGPITGYTSGIDGTANGGSSAGESASVTFFNLLVG